jgi:hypothetical protein
MKITFFKAAIACAAITQVDALHPAKNGKDKLENPLNTLKDDYTKCINDYCGFWELKEPIDQKMNSECIIEAIAACSK